MRHLLFALVFSLSGNIGNCQQYSKVPIPVSDFIKGLDNFDYLRGILVENGFQLFLNSGGNEKWLVFKKREQNLNLALLSGVLLSVNFITSERDSLYTYQTIIFQVNMEEMSDYNTLFFNDIKKIFPDRKIEHIGDNYLLYYSNKNSKHEIIFQDGVTDFQYQFIKHSNVDSVRQSSGN